MSDMYAIKTSTLTAMGDVIRDKIWGEDIPYLRQEVVLALDSSYSTLSTPTIKYTVPNCSQLKVRINPIGEYSYSNFNWMITYWTGSGNTTSQKQIDFDTVFPYEFIHTEPTISFYGTKHEWWSQVSGSRLNTTTFDVELIGLDADGNEVKFKYTPIEMVEEFGGMVEDYENQIDELIEYYESQPLIPDSAFTITGDCSYRFAYGGWDWFLKLGGDKITTKDITNANYMFANSTLKSIPFEINFKEGGGTIAQMFQNSALEVIPSIDFKQANTGSYAYKNWDCIFAFSRVKEIGTMKNLYPNAFGGLFESAYYLRYLPKIENLDGSYARTYGYASNDSVFKDCKSLRSIPEDFLKQIYGYQTSYYYCHLNNMFTNCNALDEVRGVMPVTGAITSNMLNQTAYYCYRLKDFIFAFQEDGTPYTAQWKNQTFDLTTVGWASSAQLTAITNAYNSGISQDKQVRTDAEYQALKDDPDWFALDVNYSRYNHDSAVRTIISLPDCSATGTNTIKFKGEAGAKTDGGAINTLTEEEIAVAVAKGWTVSLV